MQSRVIVFVKNGHITIHHTPDTEVACIVEGEDVHVPDEWFDDLTEKVDHSLPITIGEEIIQLDK